MQKILAKLSSKSDNMPLRIDLREPLVLRTLVETVEDLTAQIALQDGVNIKFETQGLSEAIFAGQKFSGDINKLCEILINLVGNAIKYSPRGQTVSVKLIAVNDRADSTDIRFEIMNKGKGIPKAVQENVLFKRYSQSDKAVDTSVKASSGLGLYISQEFAKLMGGKICVESDPEIGETDTLFHFTLNFKKQHDEPAAAVTSLLSPLQTISSPLLPTIPFRFSNPHVSILTADDTTSTLRIYKQVFNRAGCKTVEQFSNGEKAVDNYLSHDYDVCLLDMNMGSGINGWQTALKIYEIALSTDRKPPYIYLCTGDSKAHIDILLCKPPTSPAEEALQQNTKLVPKGTTMSVLLQEINHRTSLLDQ